MNEKRLLIWGLVALLGVFGVINAIPYWIRATATEQIQVQIISVTHEDGEPVSFLSQTQALGREFARRLVDFLDIRTQQTDVHDAYLVAVEVTNNSAWDFALISGRYRLFINDELAATGNFDYDPAKDLLQDQSLKMWLPCELRVPTTQFGNLVKEHRKGTIKGHIWIPRGSRKIRIEFHKEVNLAHL